MPFIQHCRFILKHSNHEKPVIMIVETGAIYRFKIWQGFENDGLLSYFTTKLR